MSFMFISGGAEALYLAGSRCQKNEDCTLPGYSTCDKECGLCEKPSLTFINKDLINDMSTAASKSTKNHQSTIKVGTTSSTTNEEESSIIAFASDECEYDSNESEDDESPKQLHTDAGIKSTPPIKQELLKSTSSRSKLSRANRNTPDPLGNSVYVRRYFGIRKPFFVAMKQIKKFYRVYAKRTFDGMQSLTNKGVPLEPNPIESNGHVRRCFGSRRTMFTAVNHYRRVYRVHVRRAFNGLHPIPYNGAPSYPHSIGSNGYVRNFWRIRQTLFTAVHHVKDVYRVPVQRIFNGLHPYPYNGATWYPYPIESNGYVRSYVGIRQILLAAVNHY
uniref:ShKT domain-containing protein n=1 Tax=Panagrellus redivivus TaxID=6233 RepID=A0A7E4UY23_PANRE